MDDTPLDQRRRHAIRAIGVVTVGAIAGCTDDGEENGIGDPDEDDPEDNNDMAAEDDEADETPEEDEETPEDDEDDTEEEVDAPDDVDDYMTDNEANLYDGTMADLTGEDEVTIEVGAGDDGYGYDPAAAQVDQDTTVVWEWTGEGGAHNVVSEEGDFEFANDDGGELVDEEGHTWEYTFDEEGAGFYLCEAHADLGHHGAIVVGDEEMDDEEADDETPDDEEANDETPDDEAEEDDEGDE